MVGILVAMSLVSVVTFPESVLEFVVIALPALVSAVLELFNVDQLECRLPGSTKLTPRVANSAENFFEWSASDSIAGLKNGAVAGSSTATPVPPIAMDRGSNALKGTASAMALAKVNTVNADSCAYFLRMDSLSYRFC